MEARDTDCISQRATGWPKIPTPVQVRIHDRGCSWTYLAVICLFLGTTGCGRVVSRLKSTRTNLSDLVSQTNERRPKLNLPDFNLPKLTSTKKASHFRNWRPDLTLLPYAVISDDRVHLYNIRDCEYRTEEDYDVRHFDRQVLLNDVRSVDFIVVPFKETPAIAHTMLSFGLADGQHIVFSAEARLEQGESYAALPSANKEYELMWVVGTERDLIRLRTDVRDVDVYLYPTKAKPAEAQKVFLACTARVNEIARTPEHYNLITNNCTTNIVEMVNSLRPGYIKPDFRVVLPGHSDRLAYDLGLLAADGPFEVVKAASKVNLAAKIHSDSTHFSQAIRYLR